MHFKRGTSLKFQEAETALAELKEQVCVCCLLCIFNSSFFSIFDSIVGGFSRTDSFEVQFLIKNKNYHTTS